MYQALYRKWRPRTFDDVVGQSHITGTLKTQVSTGRLSHAYLFTGTRGTGKTSCAKILARAVNCEHPVDGNPCNCCDSCRGIENGSILDVLELDAASNNGVEQVRALRDEAIYSPAAVRKRVYIVDEVHMLSIPAFNALLKILEEPPEHLMFILATTELNKVPGTILSRCQRFSFKRLQPEDISQRLSEVAGQEGIDLSPDGAALLARLADGALRDALSLLDQCAAPGGGVNQERILDALGLAGNLKIAHLINAVRKHDAQSALNLLSELYASGKDIRAVLGEMASLVRDLLVQRAAPKGGEALLTGGYDETTMQVLSKNFSGERLVRILTLLQEAQARLKNSSNPRMDAELCLIRLCDDSLDGSTDALAARVARLEEELMELKKSGLSAPSAPQNAAQPVSAPVQSADPEDPLFFIDEKDIPPEEYPPFDFDAPVPPAAPPAVPMPPVQSIPQPTVMASAVTPEQSADPVPHGTLDWANLVRGLHGNVPPAAYTFLNNAQHCYGGALEGRQLVIYAANDMAKRVLNTPDLLTESAKLAGAQLGVELHTIIKVGKPDAQTAPTSADDPLSDLLSFGQQFGNMTIR